MPSSLLIIGAGPGIGQATARRFGKAGWTVFLAGRSPERLATLADAPTADGVTVHTLAVDATDPVALRSALAEAERISGGLTAIHYNAAVVRQQDLFGMSDADVTGDLAVNVAGGLHTIRAAADLFGTRGGTILVTGGGLAIAPHPDWASLGAGKAALRNVVQGLADPLAARGIRLRLATVATLVGAGSAEADGVADTLWTLATDPAAPWEATYPTPRI